MNRLITGLFALGLGFGGSLAALEASELARGQGQQGTKLGNLDFEKYCVKEYGSGSVAVLTSGDIYGWTCALRKNGIYTAPRVDTDAACNLLYDGLSYSNAYDVHFPASWQCFRGHHP